MMRISLPFLLVLFIMTSCIPTEEKTTIVVHDEIIAEVDERLFGHFLEKPSWNGEIGPEAALIQGTHQLQDGVVEIMKEMNIPVLRFPGGTDVDLQDWTTMIDNVPGREGGRPLFAGHQGDTVTNYFGYNEACELAGKINSEMILVINFGDAWLDRKDLKEAVMHEAGLLAYCNAPVGAELPDGMPDWPSVRAANGHPEPFGVKYIQIANEPWLMDPRLKASENIDSSLVSRYMEYLEAFIDAFKSVDPDIQIIADGNVKDLISPLKERFGDDIDFLAYHTYQPWGINQIFKGEREIPKDSITPEEIWKAWVAVPGFDDQGQSVIDHSGYERAKKSGYPVAVTEWNWNGWWGSNSVDENQLGSHFTKGIGAAGYIHAILREGNNIQMAIQSMLIGNSWGITGIRVSPTMAFEPYSLPTGQVTGFYSSYHGDRLLKTTSENIPVYEQPYKMTEIKPAEKVAYLDILASRKDGKIFVHVINRHFENDMKVNVDLKQFEELNNDGVQHVFSGNIENEPCGGTPRETGCFSENEIHLKNNTVGVVFPARSVSILEFSLK